MFTKQSQSNKTINIAFANNRMEITVDGKIQTAKNQKIEKVDVKGVGKQWIAGGLVLLTESEAEEVMAIRAEYKAQDTREKLEAKTNGKTQIIETGAIKLYKHFGEHGISWAFRFGDLQEEINLPADFIMSRKHDQTLTFGIQWHLDMIEYQQVLNQIISELSESVKDVSQKNTQTQHQKEAWETDPRYGFAE